MPKFILTYHGGTPPATPEDGKAMMARWQEWVAANSAALVEPQNPLGKTWTWTPMARAKAAPIHAMATPY